MLSGTTNRRPLDWACLRMITVCVAAFSSENNSHVLFFLSPLWVYLFLLSFFAPNLFSQLPMLSSSQSTFCLFWLLWVFFGSLIISRDIFKLTHALHRMVTYLSVCVQTDVSQASVITMCVYVCVLVGWVKVLTAYKGRKRHCSISKPKPYQTGKHTAYSYPVNMWLPEHVIIPVLLFILALRVHQWPRWRSSSILGSYSRLRVIYVLNLTYGHEPLGRD